jgi:hypothetical protein
MNMTIKKIATALFLTISISSIKAQTLEESLTTTFAQMDTSKTMGAMMAASAKFDIITNKWPDEYASNYYSAYAKAMVSYVEKDTKRKDLFLDMADKYFEKAKSIQPENEETYVLAALLANARLSVDGGSRWKKYGEIFDANLNAAKAINPNNPRIYHLKGVAIYFTPKMFGGGAKNALEYLDKAKPLFETQDASSILKPHWGKGRNDSFIAKCNE